MSKARWIVLLEDNFNDGVIDAHRWQPALATVYQGEAGGVLVQMTGGNPYIFLESVNIFSGNIEMTIDWAKMPLPPGPPPLRNNNSTLRMQMTDGDMFSVGRIDASGLTPEVLEYRVWYNLQVLGTFPVDVSSAKFRITREGNVYRGFYWDGTRWILLGEMADGSIADFRARIQLTNPSDGEIHWDNFALRGLRHFEEVGVGDRVVALTTNISGLLRFPTISGLVFPIAMTPTFETNVITYVDGREQRIMGVDKPRYSIRLRYKNLSESDKNAILAFFAARRGRLEAFCWIDPTSGPIERVYVVRFEDDFLDQEHFAHRLWNYNEISFIEAFLKV